jgi:predicted RND superfamily exporter protein
MYEDTPAARYTRWIIRHRIATLIASVSIALLIATGMAGLTASNDMRQFFSDENPQLAAFEQLEARYERQDNAMFFVVARGESVLNQDGLTLLSELTMRSWQAPYSRRVSSLTNHQHTRASNDELVVAPLVEDPSALSDADRADIKAIALSEPEIAGRFVSADGTAAVVNIGLTLPEDEPGANTIANEWATALATEFRTRHPDFDIFVGGTTATDVALGKAVARDVKTLIGTSYLVIFGGLLLALRHLIGTLATLGMVSLSILVTMGVFGWMGTVLEPTAGFVPSIVMTIAVADAVHVLTTYYYELRRRRERHDAIVEAIRVNASPVFLTSITTAIGVLMLNFSDSPPYQELGNMVAVGVMAAWALSMTFLPALLAISPVGRRTRGVTMERGMQWFTELLLQHRHKVLVVSGLVVVCLTAFIPSNKLGEKWHEYFDHSFEVRLAVDASAERMGGLHALYFDVRADGPGAINDPAYLQELEAFSQWLQAQPEVASVTRVSELISRLNMNMHDDNPAFRVTPESRELSAQLLLLYELSLPLGMGLENTIDVERAGTRLQVMAKRQDSESLLAFDRRAQRWHAENLSVANPGAATGLDIVFGHINHRNMISLLQGMVIALVLISCLLVFALRSLKLGALSLVTNLAPAGLAYGTWAIIDGTIDLSASVVMCMSIGIVVDDTVHFLSKYRRARAESQASPADALRYAFNTVGVALTVTTAVLVAGFAVLTLSSFSPTVTMGTLLAITLAYALLVDFLVLPPLLLLIDKDDGTATIRGSCESNSAV